jgi:RimJ/RimL family protein N-acetyltransferase
MVNQHFYDDILVPIKKDHAKDLFSHIFQSKILDTIQWDGPKSIDDLTNGFAARELEMAKGNIHQFTIIDPQTHKPAGSIDIRLENNMYRADIGLWIGESFQGQGLGTKAVKKITKYGFDILKLEKIEASIFVGNLSSRAVFERCGYSLEGTIRFKTKKYGKLVDEWLFGITKPEFEE